MHTQKAHQLSKMMLKPVSTAVDAPMDDPMTPSTAAAVSLMCMQGRGAVSSAFFPPNAVFRVGAPVSVAPPCVVLPSVAHIPVFPDFTSASAAQPFAAAWRPAATPYSAPAVGTTPPRGEDGDDEDVAPTDARTASTTRPVSDSSAADDFLQQYRRQ